MSKSITKLLVSFGTAICFTGFLGITTTRSQPDLSNNCLSKSFSDLTINKAREDASKSEDCELSKNLIPITNDNPELIRKGDLVLMISWRHNCSPEKKCIASLKPGDEYKAQGNYDLWVTAVPELQKFILSQTNLVKSSMTEEELSKALVSRLEQYLGLKPDSNYTNFVEVWVKPEDLLRPCVDTEVYDRECKAPNQENKLDNKLLQKTREEGYPFTGLGYTYDWGNPETDIGASEFTVEKDKIVIVYENRTTSTYLQGLIPHLFTTRESISNHQ